MIFINSKINIRYFMLSSERKSRLGKMIKFTQYYLGIKLWSKGLNPSLFIPDLLSILC